MFEFPYINEIFTLSVFIALYFINIFLMPIFYKETDEEDAISLMTGLLMTTIFIAIIISILCYNGLADNLLYYIILILLFVLTSLPPILLFFAITKYFYEKIHLSK